MKKFRTLVLLFLFVAVLMPFAGCGGEAVVVFDDPYPIVIGPGPSAYNAISGYILNDNRPDLYAVWIEDSYGRKYYGYVDIYASFYIIDYFPSGYYWLYASDGWQTRMWGDPQYYDQPFYFDSTSKWFNIDLYY